MLPYCLRYKKIQKMLIQKYQKQKMRKQYYHQNVLYVVVENEDLGKSKKQKDY